MFSYDPVGRLERSAVQKVDGVDYSYKRHIYGSYYVQTFATLHDNAGEAYSIEVFDGARRVRALAVEHPGSAGGFKAQLMTFDVMGRPSGQSNPTEITGGWVPAGDDAAAGYLFTTQTYDWLGRPRLTTYPLVDGQAAHNTSELTYSGCACAGGDVTTARDERGRRKRLYNDVFGRLWKVEELNWDESVYSTTTYTYNARDQIESVEQQGQTRTFEYDGHGRLWRRITPEQGTTTYTYNPDDTVNQVTDARGATATFAYNNRHLVTQITYGVPTGVAPTANVGMGYDEAGNRTSMTDGLGSVTYNYDTLSRLNWEERVFNNVGTYRLTYEYTLSGQLARFINNQWGGGVHVAYTYDRLGQLTGVNGKDAAGTPTYAGVQDYASNIQYRASGAQKSLSYGNGLTLTLGYDKRLRLKEWKLPGVMWWEYDYTKFNENTGRVTYARNVYDNTLDRSFDYDHLGRLWEAHSGNEARGHVGIEPWPSQPNGPFSHSYRYDEWGNMFYRVGWGGWFGSYVNQYQTFSGNRQQTNPTTGQALTYDAAGNLKHDGSYWSYQYDATGQQTSSTDGIWSTALAYDGDGLRARRTENGQTTYFLRSTVLNGQSVAEIRNSGGWYFDRGYVYSGWQMLAVQQANSVKWVHQDPVTKSQRLTTGTQSLATLIDLDAWGGETGRTWGTSWQPHVFASYDRDGDLNDDAMMRRYSGRRQRFFQPDPADGSYDDTNPQSFNRYTYAQNDPVNLGDPTGLYTVCMGGSVRVLTTTTYDVSGGRIRITNVTHEILSITQPSCFTFTPFRSMQDDSIGARIRRPIVPEGLRRLGDQMKREQQVKDAMEKELNECVNNSPESKEYRKKMREMYPPPKLSDLIAPAMQTWAEYGYVRNRLGPRAAARATPWSALADIIIFDLILDTRHYESRQLYDRLIVPATERCRQQVNQKYAPRGYSLGPQNTMSP